MTVVEMQQYRGADQKPEDFDAFWDKQKQALSLYVPAFTLEKAGFQLPDTSCYDLNFRSFDGARIHCKIAKPAKEEQFPVLCWYHGYKYNPDEWASKVFWANQGFCVVAMDVRGQGGSSQDLPSGYGSTCVGHLIAGVDSGLEDMTFLKAYKDIVCMVRLVQSVSGVCRSQ